jgi:DNA-binding beta-propeller fold protein YncE
MQGFPYSAVAKRRAGTRVSPVAGVLAWLALACCVTAPASAQWYLYTALIDEIVAIDAATHSVVGSLHPDLMYGFKVTPDGTYAVAAREVNWDLYDLATMTRADVDTYPPGLGCGDLMSTAMSHNGTRIYTSYIECRHENIAILNLLTGEWKFLYLELPAGFDITPDSAFAYVGTEHGVVAIDTESLEILPTELSDLLRHYTFTPDGTLLLNARSPELEVTETKHHTLVGTVPVNARAGGIACGPDGTCYAAGLDDDGVPVVWVIDTATLSVVDTIEVLAVDGWVAIRPDGVFGYVAGIHRDGTPLVSVFDTAARTLVTGIELERLTNDRAFRPDGAYLYTPGPLNTVTVIDTRANTLATPISLARMVYDVKVAPAPDPDGDRIGNGLDNCVAVANADQRDTDGDNIGNTCDADFNGDCLVDAADRDFMHSAFFSTDADADLNGDGNVNAVDLGLLRESFLLPPGPSGKPNACDTQSLVQAMR